MPQYILTAGSRGPAEIVRGVKEALYIPSGMQGVEDKGKSIAVAYNMVKKLVAQGVPEARARQIVSNVMSRMRGRGWAWGRRGVRPPVRRMPHPGMGQFYDRAAGYMQVEPAYERPVAGLGQAVAGLSETQIIASIDDVYFSANSRMETALRQARTALEGFNSQIVDFKKEASRKVIADVQKRLGPAAWMGLGPVVLVAYSAMGISKVYKDAKLAEKSREVWRAVADTVRHVRAMSAALSDLRMSDVVGAGIIDEDEARPFLKRINARWEDAKDVPITTLMIRWADQVGTKFERFVRSSGNYLAVVNDLEAMLKAMAPAVGEDPGLVGGPDPGLVAEFKKGLLNGVVRAKAKALASEPDPTIAKEVWSWIREAARTLLVTGAAVFGLIASVFGFSFEQFSAQLVTMVTATQRAMELIRAAIITVGVGAETYSTVFGQKRVKEGKDEATAKKEAFVAADEKMDEVGTKAFTRAFYNLDEDHRNFIAIFDHLKDVLGLGIDILKYLLFGVAAVGGYIVAKKTGIV